MYKWRYFMCMIGRRLGKPQSVLLILQLWHFQCEPTDGRRVYKHGAVFAHIYPNEHILQVAKEW